MKTDKQIKRYVFQAFVGLVLLVNGGLTFVFGGTYGGQTFPTQLPNLSFLLGGLMLVIFYDVAAGAWFQARGREGQSNQQRAIASILAVSAMLASVSVSAIQLLMTTTLVDLSSWRNGVGVLGLIILVLMASAHFIGLFAYRYTDPRYAEQDAESELMADMQTLRLQQKRRVMQLTVSRAEELMLERVGWLAESEAETAVRQLLADIRSSPTMPSYEPNVIEGTTGGEVDSRPPSSRGQALRGNDISDEEKGETAVIEPSPDEPTNGTVESPATAGHQNDVGAGYATADDEITTIRNLPNGETATGKKEKDRNFSTNGVG